VPRRLQAVFEGRFLLWKWCQKLEWMTSELGVQDGAPHCRDIDVERIVRDLRALRAEILRGAPFGQCDCPSWWLDCPKCQGTRWTSGKNNTMAKPAAKAMLVGRLVTQPAVTAPASGVDVARTKVRCDGEVIDVVAHGQLALELSAIFSNRPVEVVGKLVVHRWTTDDHRDHERVEVEAERIREIPLGDYFEERTDQP
jgi:hypothetical protein